MSDETTPRALLAQLEAQADRQDEVMARMIDALREMLDERELLEDMLQRRVQVQLTRSAFIVEAAMGIRDAENTASGATVVPLGRYRRPRLRVVQ